MSSTTMIDPPVANAYPDGPRLLADIGGTNARFALERAPGRIEAIRVLRGAEYPEFADAVEAYLAECRHPPVRHAAIAIANPVQGDEVRMTNHNWVFSIEAMRRRLHLDTLLVVNDFTALAMSLPHLEHQERRQIGGGTARTDGVIGLVGPGTGLGVGGLIPIGGRWIALGSEGGHASFSPVGAREVAVLQYAWQKHPHVSAERLVSGIGIELIHEALAASHSQERPAAKPETPEIIRRALAGSDSLCMETVECFCAMLGTIASNVAVTLGTLGGIYIGGGIVPRLGDYFARSPFRQRFESKGRFSGYLSQVPTFVITAPYPAFAGVAVILAEHLGGGDAAPILERIRKIRMQFPSAQRKVADLVLADPRAVMNEPIAEIARRAEVGQPSVIRFCRSLGCQGLADFKLKLVSGAADTVPVAHSQVEAGDSPLDAGVKVIDSTISAMMDARDHLDREAVSRAIEILGRAAHIDFYAFGSCGLAAQDACQTFFRLGIPSAAYTDPQLQEAAAAMLKPADVAVFVSDSSSLHHLAPALETACNSGATVIALAPGNSQLARRAHLTLAVEHGENGPTQMPAASRILLLLTDVLAAGVSLKRSRLFAESQRQPGCGVSGHTAAGRADFGDERGQGENNLEGGAPGASIPLL